MDLTAVNVNFRDRSSCISVSSHKVQLAQLTQLEEQEEKNTITAMPAKSVVQRESGWLECAFVQEVSTTVGENAPSSGVSCSPLGVCQQNHASTTGKTMP